MGSEFTNTLVSILAKTDAVFVPLRDVQASTNNPAKFYFQRLDFLKRGGLPFASPGDDATRQKARRQLNEMKRHGLIHVARRTAHTPLVRLTDGAEDHIRTVCGLPSVRCGWESAKEVARRGGFVPEYILCGWRKPKVVESGSKEMQTIVAIEDMTLPALARNWLSSNSTRSRHVAYAVTDEGREAIAGPPPDDVSDAKHRKLFDKASRDLYLDLFAKARQEILTTPARDPREIGPIPLPTGMLAWPPE